MIFSFPRGRLQRTFLFDVSMSIWEIKKTLRIIIILNVCFASIPQRNYWPECRAAWKQNSRKACHLSLYPNSYPNGHFVWLCSIVKSLQIIVFYWFLLCFIVHSFVKIPKFESLLLRQGNPCKSRVSFFYATIMPPFLQRHNEGFHSRSTFFLHSYRNMRIFIHCECHCRMPEICRDCLDIHAVLQRKRSIGVPLGYNNDKTGNPYGTRVLSDSGCWIQFLFHRNEGCRSEGKEGPCKTNDKKVSRFQRLKAAVSDAPNHQRDVTFSITIS